MDLQVLTAESSEEQFAALVETAVGSQSVRLLLDLLDERHGVYEERSASTVARMRGWLLELISRLPDGAPDSALPYVLEELDSGRDPYVVAAAARALRSRHRPDPAFAPYLAQAIINVQDHDEFITFAAFGEYCIDESGATTAEAEVRATIDWLHSCPTTTLDCCSTQPSFSERSFAGADRRTLDEIATIPLQDQVSRWTTFGEMFQGRPSFLVFFYTRCDNPRKCSLTIAKLRSLQQTLLERGLAGRVRTAAITYDPAWDTPDRLRGYARNRGLHLDEENRVLRSSAEDLLSIRRYLELGVTFVESLVNHHRIEGFLLDSQGRVARRFERLMWDEEAVADSLNGLLGEVESHEQLVSKRSTAEIASTITSAMAPLAVLGASLIPKCPLCWTAYMSALGIAGLDRLSYPYWLLPLLSFLALVNLGSLWLRGRANGRMAAFYLGAAAVFVVLMPTTVLSPAWIRPAAVVLTLAASLMSVSNALDRLRVHLQLATHRKPAGQPLRNSATTLDAEARRPLLRKFSRFVLRY